MADGLRRVLIGSGIAASLFGLVAAGATHGVRGKAHPTLARAADTVPPGGAAPAIRLAALHGDRFDLGAERGHVVALAFFASWCEPCNREAPALEALSRRERGVRVIGIDEGEAAAEAAGFVRKHSLTYPIALDGNGAVATAYRVIGLPTLVVIGRDGTIGAEIPGESTAAALDRAVNETSARMPVHERNER